MNNFRRLVIPSCRHFSTGRRTSDHYAVVATTIYDFDSTAILPRYDHSTTYVTIIGLYLPVCGLH